MAYATEGNNSNNNSTTFTTHDKVGSGHTSSPVPSESLNHSLTHQHPAIAETVFDPQWDQDDKMESLTQRTERSQEETINSASLVNPKEHVDDTDEDDNTTIQSLESAMAHHEMNYTSYSSAAASASSSLYGGYNHGMPPSITDASGVSTAIHNNNNHQPQMVVGTPSTTSTAPSSVDDVSLGIMGDSSALGMTGPNNAYHRRVPSWEGLPQPVHSHHVPPPSPNAWGSRGVHHHPQQQQQQRVATFRSELDSFPPMVPSTPRWTGNNNTTTVPFLPHTTADPHARIYQHASRPPHSVPPAPQQQQQPSYSMRTPPRVARSGPRHPVPTNMSPHGTRAPPTAPAGSRSSSEVLKTLLRKKACLYEPETSRAVTLITWLVGRQLAIANGFFSRQQLQAGVHSCVHAKIESGVITRTKVNRCMQIILNSCFHYIIPRPDGTEEKGDMFRWIFAKEVSDDDHLLSLLPAPWNDMKVDREEVLKASMSDLKSPASTPQPSPQLTSRNAEQQPSKGSPGKDISSDGAAKASPEDSKRAVLLCFNENVRCAEDVFRCHNEFIRDTAHAANLQLGSLEWRNFFAKEATSHTSLCLSNVGISVPRHDGNDNSPIDALGILTSKEAGVFRTSWCAKRYDHNHELCGFAHAEVNNGWLRRNPALYSYKDEKCPSIIRIQQHQDGGNQHTLILNECPHGVNCSFAHSMEEIAYHPRRYKAKLCHSASTPGGCRMGDVCPHFHPLESYRFPKKSDSRSPRHGRSVQQQAHPGKSHVGESQDGVSILYASPAPLSSFEEHLLTPGLKHLYRRQCAVARENVRSKQPSCVYNLFGNDSGIGGKQQHHAPPTTCHPAPIGPVSHTT